MTTAKHVANYRKAHLGVDKERLTVILAMGTKAKLAQLAEDHGCKSITEFLERLGEFL